MSERPLLSEGEVNLVREACLSALSSADAPYGRSLAAIGADPDLRTDWLVAAILAGHLPSWDGVVAVVEAYFVSVRESAAYAQGSTQERELALQWLPAHGELFLVTALRLMQMASFCGAESSRLAEGPSPDPETDLVDA